jgi:tetratricopeptide (TPR) repeat protein
MKKALYFLFLIYQFTYGQDKTKELIKQALVYEQNGDIQNAITTHEKVLKINPKSFQSANSIAGLYGQLGNSENEISWAKKAIEINPKYFLAYINLGNGYALKNDFVKANEYYKIADKLEPSNPLPLYSIGVMEESNGNFESAISYYEQSVSRDKTFENGYFNLAAAYANIKDFKNADKNIKKVLELNPNASDAQEMQKYITKELLKH